MLSHLVNHPRRCLAMTPNVLKQQICVWILVRCSRVQTWVHSSQPLALVTPRRSSRWPAAQKAFLLFPDWMILIDSEHSQQVGFAQLRTRLSGCCFDLQSMLLYLEQLQSHLGPPPLFCWALWHHSAQELASSDPAPASSWPLPA